MSRSLDAEIAELVFELRQAWFGRVEPPLSFGARFLVGFMGSAIVLIIMMYLILSSGEPDAQTAQLETVFIPLLSMLTALPILLAFLSRNLTDQRVICEHY
ncbi:MAG: hypothetical protein OXC53_12460 [Rhodobacteraceae bacterium]|nr:hypothetical protein [Paracoccaceae bacterium]